jgi:hypothetical protein
LGKRNPLECWDILEALSQAKNLPLPEAQKTNRGLTQQDRNHQPRTNKMDDPKIDPERMKQWKANIQPVPSAERLKGKGSGAAPCSSVSDEIIAFLLGEGPLDGVYFGEKHPFHEGRYWWRKHLRKNQTGQERVASADPNCSKNETPS